MNQNTPANTAYASSTTRPFYVKTNTGIFQQITGVIPNKISSSQDMKALEIWFQEDIYKQFIEAIKNIETLALIEDELTPDYMFTHISNMLGDDNLYSNVKERVLANLEKLDLTHPLTKSVCARLRLKH